MLAFQRFTLVLLRFTLALPVLYVGALGLYVAFRRFTLVLYADVCEVY